MLYDGGMARKKFDIIIFTGRPGAGKSEVIDFLKKQSPAKRLKDFYTGRIVEMDDFNFLLKRGGQDDAREKKGLARLDTERTPHSSYRVKSRRTYDRLTQDLNKYFKKHYNRERFFAKNTLFIEFSRGGRDAYAGTLKLLDRDIRKRAVILYVRVSFRESLRKNRKRFDPAQKDSILFHKVPYRVMLTYRIDDWDRIACRDKNYIFLKHEALPYLVFQNEPEKTSSCLLIRKELQKGLSRLFHCYGRKGIRM